jgi:kynurenine formamidase
MRIRSFIIAYALVLAILLFADRRPGSTPQGRYSHVVDLTIGDLTNRDLTNDDAAVAAGATAPRSLTTASRTRIIAPGALIPGTWTAGQIPAERLVAPLVVLDLDPASSPQVSSPISLDDIALWEAQHGMIPQGAVVAIRRLEATPDRSHGIPSPFPIAPEAAMFLIEARSTIGFAIETPANLTADRTLARQLALHGTYVVERAAPFTALPATGSLIIVAPAKTSKPANVRTPNARTTPARTPITKATIDQPGEAAVRVLAMVR